MLNTISNILYPSLHKDLNQYVKELRLYGFANINYIMKYTCAKQYIELLKYHVETYGLNKTTTLSLFNYNEIKTKFACFNIDLDYIMNNYHIGFVDTDNSQLFNQALIPNQVEQYLVYSNFIPTKQLFNQHL